MNTYEHRIDDLLAKVSKDLVEKYEQINLPPGTTLKAVNDEYKTMNKNTKGFLIMMQLFVSILALVILFLSFLWTLKNNEYFSVALIPTLIWVVLSAATLSFLDKRAVKIGDKLGVLTAILMEFREVIEALDNLPGYATWYDETCVREILIVYAMSRLEAERAFDKVRLLPERRTTEILRCGSWYEKCQEDLRVAFMVASKKFGLEFTRSDIFGEATKRIASRT